MNTVARIAEVDALRGTGILLVVLYHIFFDIYYFGLAKIDINSLPIFLLGRGAASLLIFVVGISLALSYEKAKNEGKNIFWKFSMRGAQLFGVALLISVATWVYPHDGWIFFGIIHFIAVAVFICHFFAKYFRLNLVLGVLSILFGFWLKNFSTSNIFLFILGMPANIYTLDYFSIFPWIGVVFLGMFFAKAAYVKNVFNAKAGEGILPYISNVKNAFVKLLVVAGKNSLLIYLTHQLVLVGIIFIAKMAI